MEMDVNMVRERIKTLYETAPQVNVNVSQSRPKLSLRNDPATILGVYTNVFRLEERSTGIPRCHTLQYKDILMGQIQIVELGETG